METCRVLNLKSLALSLSLAAIAPAAISQDVASEKVYLEADILIDDKDNSRMIAEGNVVAKYEGRELFADKVIYDLASQKVRAIGNVRIVDPDGTVRFAEEIEVDDKLEDGVATEFSAQLPQNAVVVARAANRVSTGTNSLDKVIYTACELCEENGYTPTWSLRARKAVQNAETQMITYQDAVFEIKGVPVLYLPYFAHPDPSTDRRSGFLPPTPKVSSKLGFVWQQPYYWAISPSQDLTITPNLHTNVNSSLSLGYRKRFYSGEVEAYTSFAYDYMFDSDGERQVLDRRGNIVTDPDNYAGVTFPSESSLRSHIFARGEFEIHDKWDWGFGAARVTDDTYLKRYDISNPIGKTGIYSIGGQRLLSQVYAVRQDEDSYFDAAMFSVQSLTQGERDDAIGVATPIMFGEKVVDFGDKGVVSFIGSTLILNRTDGDDTRRLTGAVEWDNVFVAPAGLILEPTAKVRADYYDYSYEATSQTAQIDDTKTRTSAMVGATLRWPFMKLTETANYTIEPVVTVAYSELSVENGVLPNEDAANFEYTLISAFEADPFGTSDLIESGARIAAGIRGEADFGNGLKFNGALARRWRDEVDSVFEVGSNLDGTESDYLIGAGVSIGDYLKISSNLRVDDDFQVQRIESNARVGFGPFSATATYFDLNSDVAFSNANAAGQEGIQLSSTLKVTKNIDLVYSQLRNIETGQNASRAFGIKFYDECSYILISYEDKDLSDRNVGSGSTIKIAFGLKTLGEVSDDTFD